MQHLKDYFVTLPAKKLKFLLNYFEDKKKIKDLDVTEYNNLLSVIDLIKSIFKDRGVTI